MGAKLSKLRRRQQTKKKQTNSLDESRNERACDDAEYTEKPANCYFSDKKSKLEEKLGGHFVENYDVAVLHDEDCKQSIMVEFCSLHTDRPCTYWCEECKAPACDHCICITGKLPHHWVKNLQDEYGIKRVNAKKAIIHIHRWILPRNIMIRGRMDKDIQNVGTSGPLHDVLNRIQIKANNLKHLLARLCGFPGRFLLKISNVGVNTVFSRW
jgi:hypothetical protein